MTAEFAKREGRQPRIMIAKMGQDGHDRGAKCCYRLCRLRLRRRRYGTALPDPAEAARKAVENDVHILGVSLSPPQATRPSYLQVIEELQKSAAKTSSLLPAV